MLLPLPLAGWLASLLLFRFSDFCIGEECEGWVGVERKRENAGKRAAKKKNLKNLGF